MKAARLVSPRRWEVFDVDRSEPTEGTMRVRLERTAICGTDKPAYVGLSEKYPMEVGRSGHEALGIVEACPSGKYREGERVLLWGFHGGGLFQECVLASDDGGCIRLPDAGKLEVLLMSQLFGTVLHAFYKLGNIIGQDVVVLGQGPVGQLFNAALSNLGARRIIAVDPLEHRREIAHQMKATHSLVPGPDLRQRIIELCDGEQPAMLVEAVGKTETFNRAATLVCRGGTILYFGVPNKDDNSGIMPLEFLRMFSNELRIVTTVGPNPYADYAVALQWIVEKRIDVRPILTHTLPFTEIQSAFEMAFDEPEKHGAVKIVMHFDD